MTDHPSHFRQASVMVGLNVAGHKRGGIYLLVFVRLLFTISLADMFTGGYSHLATGWHVLWCHHDRLLLYQGVSCAWSEGLLVMRREMLGSSMNHSIAGGSLLSFVILRRWLTNLARRHGLRRRGGKSNARCGFLGPRHSDLDPAPLGIDAYVCQCFS